MRVKINQVPEGKVFTLEVESYYTDLTIKKRLNIYRISCDSYTLTYESIKIKNNSNILVFDVKDIRKLAHLL